jgi:hypothetical protein
MKVRTDADACPDVVRPVRQKPAPVPGLVPGSDLGNYLKS